MYKENLIPICYNRCGKNLKQLKGIVIHYVSNPNTSAEANRSYFINNTRGASSHDIIDLNGDVIHMIPYTEIAYHVGVPVPTFTPTKIVLCGSDNPNNYFIGIEMCHIDSSAKPTDIQKEALINLCVDLCKQFNLTEKDLYLHNDICSKQCHLYYVNNRGEWDKVKTEVKNRISTPQIPIQSNYDKAKAIIEAKTSEPDGWIKLLDTIPNFAEFVLKIKGDM